MKYALLIPFLLTNTFGYAQSPLLDSVLRHNSYALRIEDGKPTGPGWNHLLSHADTADLVLFGENHGIKEIAGFSNEFYRALSATKPRLLITEMGPATAREVEEMLKKGIYEAFMAEGTNLHSVPFFFLKQELPLLRSAMEFNQKGPRSIIWGLDQEFIAGAPVVLSYLEKFAFTEQEKQAVKTARRKALLNPFLIGMGSDNALKALEKAFEGSASPEARHLTRQLVLSHKIYKEQMGGDTRWSNERRETLMMENFLDYVREYPNSIPPMFFKFGSYHLHKGESPTVEEALGLRLEHWASERGLSTINVFVDAKAGQMVNALMGGTTALPWTNIWEQSAFAPYVKDSPVLFDLRPLRKMPEVNDWYYELQYMLSGYDYLLVFPEATPQEFLEGTLVTHRYGLIAGIILLFLLSSLIYMIVRWVRRRKRKRKVANT